MVWGLLTYHNRKVWQCRIVHIMVTKKQGKNLCICEPILSSHFYHSGARLSDNYTHLEEASPWNSLEAPSWTNLWMHLPNVMVVPQFNYSEEHSDSWHFIHLIPFKTIYYTRKKNSCEHKKMCMNAGKTCKAFPISCTYEHTHSTHTFKCTIFDIKNIFSIIFLRLYNCRS